MKFNGMYQLKVNILKTSKKTINNNIYQSQTLATLIINAITIMI
jgi:hypothetical protein